MTPIVGNTSYSEGEETYRSLMRDLNYVDEYKAIAVGAGQDAFQPLDVVTIRNRCGYSGTNLSGFIRRVRMASLKRHTTFHCFFCRGRC